MNPATPETSKEANYSDASGWFVPLKFAESLELQRNEALKQARFGWERHAEKDAAYGEALKQRDALLSALEALLEKVHCGTALNCDLCNGARAAIALVKGAQ